MNKKLASLVRFAPRMIRKLLVALALICAGYAVLWSNSAFASSCDVLLNSYQVNDYTLPEIQDCVRELRSERRAPAKTDTSAPALVELELRSEIELLRSELCDLAVRLASLKSDVDDFIKETCVPLWQAAKKRQAKKPQPRTSPAAR
jgi:hypothetical protein